MKKLRGLKRKIKKKIFNSFFSEFRFSNSKNLSDFRENELNIIDMVKPYTMTSPERIVSLIRAVNYLEQNKIYGDIVECGVWKGGSIMAVLLALKEKNRNIYLYDTFDGMTEPSLIDKSYRNESAKIAFSKKDNYWKKIECLSTLDEVKKNIEQINYPKDKIIFVEGKVENTIPNFLPNEIALLRLDTDWYESTKHEMFHLFPKLVKGGVIIVDDYGHWQGCQKAIDEYLSENNVKLLLNRIDYTGRIGIKL